MLIGEVTKLTGLSRDTIRFYEKQRLIKPLSNNKNEINNYKNYNEETIKRLHTIQRIKAFGFTLTEIADLLPLIDDNKASCDVVIAQAKNKVELIERKIAEMETKKSKLVSLITNCYQPVGVNCPSLCV